MSETVTWVGLDVHARSVVAAVVSAQTGELRRANRAGVKPGTLQFFASLEKELLRRERFDTREQARMRIFWYIECFYNTRRRHTSLGGISPQTYEQQYYEQANAA